ncbi:amidase [Phenylobacterium sp. J426]|uniref:amidase n=1 Tax=Phenylobacterium sp. J426 TaxID=2898439 RepID=UPI00215074FB|nr:amidase [Phenylobacterium sp. J426]MCR5872752.1 amidase [Phenylobacterium sp. J426]
MLEITRRALVGAPLAVAACASVPAAPASGSAWPDATETAARIRAGALTPHHAVSTAIDRALRLQPQLNFLVQSDFERALAKAAQDPTSGPFPGVPFLIKDLDDYAGLPTRSGSRSQLALPAASRQGALVDAFVQRAGVVVVGKSSTPEYGFLPTTEPAAFGPTRNPWDPSRSSGGSSGGAAAAVAAGVVPFAHASDGDGSIRIPASCCGLFGLKPSRGRMIGSRGDTRISDLSVDHVLTRSVRDSAAMFASLEDNGEGAQHPAVGFVSTPIRRKLRIGLVMQGMAGHAPSPEVRTATLATVALLETIGHTVVETRWPTGPEFIDDFLLLWASGAAQLADAVGKAAGRRPDATMLEPFSLGMAEMFRKAPPGALDAALQRLHAAAMAYDPWFVSNQFDVILSPVLAAPPPPLGFLGPDVAFDALVARLTEYVGYTTYHNVVGAPAMSVPLNWTPSGLPVGSQFAARVGHEALLFQLAYQLEAARPWAGRTPPVHA